ncbi:MAG: hypothetical protein ACJAUP_001150 [Cellvibrionaceae bacterium]|jgi:hypothetical protein
MHMGLIIKFFCFLLVLGLAGLFVLKKPDGTPWLSVDDLIPDTSLIKRSVSDAMSDQFVGGSDGNFLDEKVSVYKWKDADGNWQFSDTPPENVIAQQILVGTNVNRDLAPLPASPLAPREQPENRKTIPIKDGGFSPTTIAPNKVSKLVGDAKGVQKLVDDRQKKLDAALGSKK